MCFNLQKNAAAAPLVQRRKRGRKPTFLVNLKKSKPRISAFKKPAGVLDIKKRLGKEILKISRRVVDSHRHYYYYVIGRHIKSKRRLSVRNWDKVKLDKTGRKLLGITPALSSVVLSGFGLVE